MKHLLTVPFAFIFSLSTANCTTAQCNLKEIFPFTFGMSKFDAIAIVNTNSSLKPDDEANKVFGAPRHIWSESKKDSVLYSVYYCELDYSSCFHGYDRGCTLFFSNDKLYQIEVNEYFQFEELSKCINDYGSLKNYLGGYYFSVPFTLKQDEEKTGEGMDYYADELESMTGKKASASLLYKVNYNPYLLKKNNDVYCYSLELEWHNWKYKDF